MRIVVASANRQDREQCARCLEVGGHRLEVGHDVQSTVAALGRSATEVMLLDAALPAAGARDVLARVRGIPAISRPWVILILDKNPGPELGQLVDEGADDFVRKPLWKEELIARVEAPLRLRLKADGVRLMRDWSQARDPLEFWADPARIVAHELGAFTQLCVDVQRGDRGWPEERRATVGLFHHGSCAEVRVHVACDHHSLEALGRVLLGAMPQESATLDDVLREALNSVAGALKRAAPEDEPFTLGLPRTVTQEEMSDPAPPAGMRFACKAPGVTLAFALETARYTRQRLPAFRLREGMILATDLRSESGALLVPRGTRLTSTAAERVASLLGKDQLIEIDAAA